MKTVYYEVLEFEGELLKNIYYYAHNDILDSKTHAERYFSMKTRQAQLSNSLLNYKLVFAIIEDYQTTRHILNEKDTNAHQLESMILSSLTGQQVEIPEWPQREARLMEEYV
jgi:hypothetical protein